ncbi:MAG: PEGA domain-containing protein [Patescibacteria group bacterium]
MADRVSTIFSPAGQKYYAPTTQSSVTGKKSRTRNIVAFIVTAFGVILTSYFGYILVSRSNSPSSKPYLYADVYYGKAKVFVNDKEVGETPLENFVVKKGSNKVKLESNGKPYETTISFLAGLPTLVKRDLGTDEVFSSGLDLWYEKSSSANTLSVISQPSEAIVFIDGTEAGKTPFSTDKLTAGSYDVRLEKEGYEPQSGRLNVIKDQKINASFKLFPMPAPITVKIMDGSTNLYDIYSNNSFVTSSPQSWAKALIYWNKTRGINIMGYGINRELVFSYILDFDGKFYDTSGVIVEPNKVLLGDGKIAYLRRESDGAGISSQAKESLAKIGTSISIGKTAKVKDTSTGWLRVRSQPSLAGAEVGRLNIGDTVSVLEEKPGWLKIKSTAGLEGWASSDYLQLL